MTTYSNSRDSNVFVRVSMAFAHFPICVYHEERMLKRGYQSPWSTGYGEQVMFNQHDCLLPQNKWPTLEFTQLV